jgi:hypothetical protein
VGEGIFACNPDSLTIYYLADKAGWTNPWNGYNTAPFTSITTTLPINSNLTITAPLDSTATTNNDNSVTIESSAQTPIVNLPAGTTGSSVSLTVSNTTDGGGMVVVSGATLPDGSTKTIYVPKQLSSNYVCVNDSEGVTLISSTCDQSGEVVVPCSGSVGSITCTVEANDYAVNGLSHSAVAEVAQPIVPSDLTALNAARASAQSLITANAPESTIPGQHIVGSLAALIAANNAANAQAQISCESSLDACYDGGASDAAISDPINDISACNNACAAATQVYCTTADCQNYCHKARVQGVVDCSPVYDQATIDAQTDTLNAAILAYNTAIVQPSDASALTAARASTQSLINANASEGTTPGQHIAGSLNTLKAAFSAANATEASDQNTVDTQAATLLAAIADYTAAVVPPSDASSLIAAQATALGYINDGLAESKIPGDKVVGSHAALQTALNLATATDADSQSVVDAETAALNTAITTYINATVQPAPVTTRSQCIAAAQKVKTDAMLVAKTQLVNDTTAAKNTRTSAIASAKSTITQALAGAKSTKDAAVNGAKATQTQALAIAKSARDASISGAMVTKTQALAQAKTTKDAALALANAMTDKKAKTQAIKAANDAYTAAVKAANSAYTTVVKAANTAYTTAVKTANTAYTSVTKAANDAYKTNIKAANDAYTTVVKAANSAYKTVVATSNTAYQTSVKAIQAAYKTAVQACPKK